MESKFELFALSKDFQFSVSDDNQEAEACVELDTEDVYKKIEAFAKVHFRLPRKFE